MALTICWILTILLPIHGAFWLGWRKERERVRRITMAYWKLSSRTRK